MSRNQTDGGISQAMPTLVWTHSSNLQTCEHDPTITLKMSRKQTDGGMSQLLAIAGLGLAVQRSKQSTIAGLDSQSEPPKM